MQKQNVNTITYGMRKIENPFEDEVLGPENQVGDVVVEVKDYKWYKMYKNDIIVVSVMIVIAIMVVILSVFSFGARVQIETVSSRDKAKADSAMMHSFLRIEQTAVKLKEEVDSLDMNIIEGEKNLSNAIRELKGKKGVHK